jgi:hypothetical protein
MDENITLKSLHPLNILQHYNTSVITDNTNIILQEKSKFVWTSNFHQKRKNLLTTLLTLNLVYHLGSLLPNRSEYLRTVFVLTVVMFKESSSRIVKEKLNLRAKGKDQQQEIK